MRIKDLKPNTEYATCDGKLVVTGDVVEGGHYSFNHTVDGKTTFKVTKGDPAAGKVDGFDPWANCDASQRLRSNSGIRYVVKGGVKVTQYDWDRDGKRKADGRSLEMVVKPQDIPGLWSEYVSLHAERILGRYLTADAEKEAKEMSAKLDSVMRASGLPSAPVPASYGDPKPPVHTSVTPLLLVRHAGRNQWQTHAYNATPRDKMMMPKVEISGAAAIDALLVALGQEPIFGTIEKPKRATKMTSAKKKAAPKKAGK